MMTISRVYAFALSFFAGVSMASLWSISLSSITWCFFLAGVLVLLWRRSVYTKEIKMWLYGALCMFGLAVGLLRTDSALQSFGVSPLQDAVGEEVTLTGSVRKEPDVRAQLQYLEVKTETDVVLVSVERQVEVSYGDEVTVQGVLKEPEPFLTDLGRVFAYDEYLRVRGIEYTISFAEVAVNSADAANLFLKELFTFKQSFMEQIERFIPEPAAGLGEGLLLGVKQALGDELETAFRKTGIIHIVVLSGYNVMLVVVFVLFILGQFLPKRPKIFVGLLAIVCFALLVGLSATVVRASIMAALLLIAEATGRLYFVVRGLLVAGFIMVCINPLVLVFDIGFQLSFMATLGLIFIAPHLEALSARVPATFGVRAFFTATLATQIAVLPLLLYHIGEFSVVAIFVNILVLPMVPIAMLLTFLVGSIGFLIPTLASLLAYPATFVLSYIVVLAEWFSELPFAAYAIPQFPAFVIPVFYGLLVLLLVRFRSHTPVGFSEIGEQLLRTKEPSDPLASWVIEEEVETKTTSQGEVVETQKGKTGAVS